MRAIWTLAHLTIHEALRRRVLLAVLIGGVAFLTLFGVGFHFIEADVSQKQTLVERRMILNMFLLAGLYAVNFLTAMTAVLLPVDTLSGEIASGVMQTLASKPVRRSAIVLGKWSAYVLVTCVYLLVMAGGVLLIGRVMGGVTPPNVSRGLPLMMLEVLVLVTLAIAGGTRLGTLTNGVMVFSLYGLAFIGGWVEQIGSFARNDAARYAGTAASLIMPTEAMWQLASHYMQPAIMRELQMTPFSPASVATPAMVVWAVGYVVVTLAIGLRAFSRRPL
ncbi:MAG: ABC transporter permease [Candidatus Eisenbacteria bacterium]|uniref:ABC transporter permease n=1 Tax=Eiseniibacteriota bacterium TaxID=2212470 RepID=A0A849SH74_UNCEI|nr:ABC transporter permease [Candidatus Eisenbacteria bacterium]